MIIIHLLLAILAILAVGVAVNVFAEKITKTN